MSRAIPEPEIVHRDRHLLVLLKPSGLNTTSQGSEDSLTERAKALAPRAAKVHPTSRLDREVTGLVTFALTAEAIEALLEARRQGTYRRRYLALGQGAPSPAEGDWETWIAIDPNNRRLRVVIHEENSDKFQRSQNAHSRYRVLAEREGCGALLLLPQTGRTHQLRLHASWAGTPLLGDTSYGGPRHLILGDGRSIKARRVMLHCAALTIPDVGRGDGAQLELRAPVPEDLRTIWERLGGEVGELEEELSPRRPRR